MTRHVLISGGGSGVGAELAQGFADAGDKVTILGRGQAALDETAQATGALPLACDVTDRDAVDAAVARASAEQGAPTVVIANAGYAPSAPFEKITQEEFDRTQAVNVTGTFNLWQSALPGLKSAGGGRLIAIASTAGLKGYPYVAPYCAAKHAVVGLVRALALELARKQITVNAICPGFIDTPLLARSIEKITQVSGQTADAARRTLQSSSPQNRFITTQEVTAAALYLASQAAGSVNGHTLSLSGGEI